MNETFEEKKHISELNSEISDESDKNEKILLLLPVGNLNQKELKK